MKGKSATTIGIMKEGDNDIVTSNLTRVQHWKQVMLGGFNTMFKLNLLSIIALLPILFVVYSLIVGILNTSAILPFSSVIGVGYIPIIDAGEIAHASMTAIYTRNLLIILPIAVLISGTLFSGLAYAYRNASYAGGFVKAREVLTGLKFNFSKCSVLALIAAMLTAVFAFAFINLNTMIFLEGVTFLIVLSIIAMAILGIASLVFVFYAFSIAVTYDLKFSAIIKHALRFTFKLPIQNIMILVLVLLPIGLLFISPVMISLVITLFLFFGVSYMASIWTVYSQHIFDLATPDNLKKKQKKQAPKEEKKKETPKTTDYVPKAPKTTKDITAGYVPKAPTSIIKEKIAKGESVDVLKEEETKPKNNKKSKK